MRSNTQSTTVWSHQETGNAWTYRRDQAVAELLRERGIPWHSLASTAWFAAWSTATAGRGQWETHDARTSVRSRLRCSRSVGIDPGELPEQVVRRPDRCDPAPDDSTAVARLRRAGAAQLSADSAVTAITWRCPAHERRLRVAPDSVRTSPGAPCRCVKSCRQPDTGVRR